jgi:ubiquinone/menaquinone biosynthesis C-methylase UbiE
VIRKLLQLGVSCLAKYRYRQEPPEKQLQEIILNRLQPDHTVLDAGCGSIARVALRGKCRMVVGVDADEGIGDNPGVDLLVTADLSRLPFRDKAFDIVMSYEVVEHLTNPAACFLELHRVCKDGAIVVLATVNKLHYENFVVALTPYSFHEWYIKKVLGDKGVSYPTSNRANTPGRLRRMMERAGFTTIAVQCIDSGPIYLSWLTPLYAMGVVYHRLVNRFDKLSCFRGDIIGIFCRG